MQSHARKTGDRIKEIRRLRGWNQKQLGEACGVTQSQVSRWEIGLDTPSPHALIVIGNHAHEDERDFWFNLAGLKPLATKETDFILIPVLRDAAAAGTPRAVSDEEIDRLLPFPRDWLPTGGSLHAIPVEGDSMEPILRNGFILIIDVEQREPEKLIDCMVVAREGDGLTVKWLRKSGKLLMLVPENMHGRNAVQIIDHGSDISIVGAVVKWIGEPPEPSKKK